LLLLLLLLNLIEQGIGQRKFEAGAKSRTPKYSQIELVRVNDVGVVPMALVNTRVASQQGFIL
jgi:hypothetical protein